MKHSFTLIIPVYNEHERIANISRVDAYLQQFSMPSDLIVVDDGSTDGTQSILRSTHLRIPHKIIYLDRNQGKGAAVRTGMRAAQGTVRGFIDADLSTSLHHLEEFVQAHTDHDVVIGTRKHRGAQLKQRQPLMRELMGKAYTMLSQKLLQVDVTDFTCGCKTFSAAAAEKIFSRTKVDRWAFDSEILFLAGRLGFKIRELPVVWTDDRRSRVRFPQDIISSFQELLQIRSLHRSLSPQHTLARG